jgi:hypothetical protein
MKGGMRINRKKSRPKGPGFDSLQRGGGIDLTQKDYIFGIRKSELCLA